MFHAVWKSRKTATVEVDSLLAVNQDTLPQPTSCCASLALILKPIPRSIDDILPGFVENHPLNSIITPDVTKHILFCLCYVTSMHSQPWPSTVQLKSEKKIVWEFSWFFVSLSFSPFLIWLRNDCPCPSSLIQTNKVTPVSTKSKADQR